MVISRYLTREIGKPFVVVLGLLMVLFASYSVAEMLSDTVNGLLPSDVIGALVALKVLISLEVLIPISLYLAVIIALGRLYSASEMTAMLALQVTPVRVLAIVLKLSVALALIVAVLSLTARPWAYRTAHRLSDRARSELNFNDMQAGTFYETPQGRRVVFIGHRNGAGQPARDVFVALDIAGRASVIHAAGGAQSPTAGAKGRSAIVLDDARIYQLAAAGDAPDEIVDARRMTLHPQLARVRPGYSSVAASSVTLARSGDPADIAEFQWRLSTPLSTLLLGLVAVPLSRVEPRHGRFGKMGVAILLYAAYYLLTTSARTWVENGVVPPLPGIWWAPALLALLLALLLAAPRLAFSRRRRS